MNEQRSKEQRAKASWTMDREDFLHHFEQVRERTMWVVSAIQRTRWSGRAGRASGRLVIWRGTSLRRSDVFLRSALSGDRAGTKVAGGS